MPHARLEAALPLAKPAALTQYRKSSPIAGYVSKRVQWASLVGLASTVNWEIYSSYA
jgi:hypothetical protein